MSVKTRKFTTVTFYFPGSFFAEESSRETDTTDPQEIAKTAPEGSFCFSLRNYIEKTTTVDGEEFKKIEADGEGGGRYYLGGTVYTLAEIKEKFSSKSSLISNLESNGWPSAILCRTGNWQPFTKKDRLLELPLAA